MAVRQDQVQLRIDFLTDESRALSKAIVDTQKLQQEVNGANKAIAQYDKELAKANVTEARRNEILKKRADAEKLVATNLASIAAEGKKVEGLDLGKVAPAQLVERAKQLQQAIKLIPASAPQFKELQGELARINTRIREINDTSKGVASKGGLLQTVLGVAGGVGVFELVKQAGAALINFGRAALVEVDKGLKADAQVKAALASTNNAAGKSFEELKKQADDLEKVTLFGGDQTEGAQALLLTFKNVKDEVFDQAIPLAQDLSTAFGQDLSASAVQLGKALDNPIQGVTALRRVGVSFTEDQQAVIKSLVETGRVADAQKIILAELESQVGGSAKAAAEAGLGPYQVLRNRLDAVSESFVTLATSGASKLLPFFRKGIEFLEALAERLTTGENATGEFASGINYLAGLIEVAVRVFQLAFKVIGAGVEVWFATVDAIGNFINKVKELPVIGELFEQYVIIPLRFVFDAIANLPAAWAGFQAATKQTIINVANDFADLLLRAQIFAKNIQAALTFDGDKKARLQGEVQALEGRRTAAAQAGKTVGQAYVEARDAVIAQTASAGGTGTTTTSTVKGGPKPPGDEDLDAARERVDKIVDTQLKGVEAGIKRQELLLENARIKGQVDEKAYQQALVQIQEEGLRKKLEIYQIYRRSQSNEALALQNELAIIEQGKAVGKVATDVIRPGGASSVSSTATSDGTAQALAVQDLGENARAAALKSRFEAALISEQDYELARLELKKQALDEEILILQQSGAVSAQETTKKEEERYRIEEEIGKKRVENKQREEDLKARIQEQAFGISVQFFNLAADLLSQDEKAKKKNAGVIKAFQSAEVITSGILEAQTSYLQAVKTFGVPTGPVIGGVLAGLAVGRSALAAAKIQNQKFSGGGFTGQGYGMPDSSGFRPAGIVHEGEYVAPKWQVEHPETGPVVRWLNSRRLRGYATGGFVAPDTTPIPFGVAGSAQVPGIDQISSLQGAVEGLKSAVMSFPRSVKANVSYLDIEEAGSTLESVRSQSEI